MIKRDLHDILQESFRQNDQMIFVSGPRQSGKTILAKMMMKKESAGRYWNFDIPGDRLLLSAKPAFFQEIDRPQGVKPLIVLDEIHKYPGWKNYLKGAFDAGRGEFHFLITGSGRLDLYQKGGDSLSGRYLYHHLFPLTIGELAGGKKSLKEFLDNPDELPEGGRNLWGTWKDLERLSGFPEPFIKGEDTFYRRWSGPYLRQIVREDIRDLRHIHNIVQMEILSSLLPGKVGSLLSINSLREDIKVAHETLQNWIMIFANFYIVFIIRPWHKRIARAVQKETKLYFFDWAAVPDPAARFENMVGLHLLKAVTGWTEAGQGRFELRFIRDRQKNEVDFMISREGKPFLLIETKLGNTEPAPGLIKMKKTMGVPAVQLVNKPGVSRKAIVNEEKFLIVSADRWLSNLPFR
ncbi:MAG: ATP-binding protein [PVC group bacterium]